jgi:hypothetical protein
MRRVERRLATAAMLAALVAPMTACTPTGRAAPPSAGASQPTRTAAPAAPAASERFDSKTYGFRVTLSAGWSEHDATVHWDGKALHGVDSPAFADFTEASTGRALVVGAAPVPAGTRLPAWQAAMVRAAPAVCSNSSAVTRTTLGGEAALAWPASCSDGYAVLNVAALHGRRGFMLFLASPTADDLTVDRSRFEAIRRSFRFER